MTQISSVQISPKNFKFYKGSSCAGTASKIKSSQGVELFQKYTDLFNSNATTLIIVETLYLDQKILDKVKFLNRLKIELNRQNKDYLKSRVDAVAFFIQRSSMIDCSQATGIPLAILPVIPPVISPVILPTASLAISTVVRVESTSSAITTASNPEEHSCTVEIAALLKEAAIISEKNKELCQRLSAYANPLKNSNRADSAKVFNEPPDFDIDDEQEDPFAGFDDERLFAPKSSQDLNPLQNSDEIDEVTYQQILQAVCEESAREQQDLTMPKFSHTADSVGLTPYERSLLDD